MLVLFYMSLVLVNADTKEMNLKIPLGNSSSEDAFIPCIMGIVQKYLDKQVVYVNLDCEADFVLQNLHGLSIASVITETSPRTATGCSSLLRSTFNRNYMIVAKDVKHFVHDMFGINRNPNWNPYARFLIIIKTLQKFELRSIFDTLLSLHVNSAVVVNGTTSAELYTYNPYANYGCGKYYTYITEFGKCSSVTENIFPEKLVTGLRKCFFNVSVPHWPPFSIDPKTVTSGPKMMGTEQHIFDLISKIEQFDYKFNFNYDPEMFSFVTNSMSVSGPMTMLQNNLTDIMLGGLLLIPSRARLFFYVHGHLDYVDELRIMVKRARENPPWKDFYLEFTPTVWALLLLSLFLYWAMIAILLKKWDKGILIMTLLDNLLSHGPSLRCRQPVKLIYLFWVWFAYLVNSFYITSLMSLTMKPSLSYQIMDEQTLRARGLEPCLSSVINRYRKSESNPNDILGEVDADDKRCFKFFDSIRSVGQSEHLYTIVFYSTYMYKRQSFYDEYGRPPVYSFRKPYSKIIYAMYFYKGFPMKERLQSLALRIRETGLSEKNLVDQMFFQNIKSRFHDMGYKNRFAMPWCIYIVGLFLSSITFAVELGSRYKNNHNAF